MPHYGETESFARLKRLIAEAADINAIRYAMNSYLDGVGSTMSSYYHYPPIGASDFGPEIQVYTHGFPSEWVEIYQANEYLKLDPMPKVAATQTAPFRWSEISRFATLSEPEKKYLELANAAGFGDGLAVPVFGPNGRNGYFAVGFGPNGTIPSQGAIAEIHWACQAVHLKFCEMILKTLPSAVSLSDRERQILSFVVRGHSNQGIASMLNISTNTVDTYVRRCFGKLEVNDRVTAGLRGLALGLVA